MSEIARKKHNSVVCAASPGGWRAVLSATAVVWVLL